MHRDGNCRDTRSTRQRFVFHAAFIRADRKFPVGFRLDKIHIASGASVQITVSDFGAQFGHVDLSDIFHEFHMMRRTRIEKNIAVAGFDVIDVFHMKRYHSIGIYSRIMQTVGGHEARDIPYQTEAFRESDNTAPAVAAHGTGISV